MAETELNMAGLEKLLKALKAKPPRARIGILGAGARTDPESKGATNAEIGTFHEFGTSKLPVRSFLRMPIITQMQKEMEKSGAFDKDTANEVVKSGTVIPWVKKMAILAEGIVADAFDTGGFGTWVPSNMRFKTVHQTLIETQQLRNSVTSEVTEG